MECIFIKLHFILWYKMCLMIINNTYVMYGLLLLVRTVIIKNITITNIQLNFVQKLLNTYWKKVYSIIMNLLFFFNYIIIRYPTWIYGICYAICFGVLGS